MDNKGLPGSNIFLPCLIGQKPIPAMKVACAAYNVCYSPSLWRALELIWYQTVAAFGAAHPARPTGKCQRGGTIADCQLGNECKALHDQHPRSSAALRLTRKCPRSTASTPAVGHVRRRSLHD